MKFPKHIFQIILGGIFALILLGALIFDISSHKPQASHKPLVAIASAKKYSIAIPSPTPTASPTATPTQSYSGFCLHVPVLMYHHVQPWDIAQAHGQTSLSVTPEYFDQQMAAVAQRYTPISAQALVDALRSHTTLPSNAIVVTLDDGYEDNYTYAYPIFQKYHVTASLMVPTGLLGGTGNNSYFTWGELKQMVDSGLIFAYDHTWSHYPVGTGSIEKDQFEIMTAKQQLESNLGKPVTIFVNPYGTGANNPRVVSELQQDGFTGAYSTIGGSYQCDSFIYSLHRIHIGNAPLSAYGL